MENPPLKLSIICPVYRVERYAQGMVDSLIEGLPSPCVEVIFVNDACPNGSMEVIERRLNERRDAVKFLPVLLHRAVNGGMAAARNDGLRVARAAVVGFVDSDDAISPGYWRCVQPLLEDPPDILEVGFQEFRDVVPQVAPKEQVVRLVDQLTIFEYGFFCWIRLYRKSMLDGLEFPPGKIYEDVRFVTEAASRASRIVRTDAPLVFYRKRPGSITAARDRRYAELIESLVSGMKHGWDGFADQSRLVELADRKILVSMMKGLRISSSEERGAYFQACDVHLKQYAELRRRVSVGVAGQLVHGVSRLLAGAGRMAWGGRP